MLTLLFIAPLTALGLALKRHLEVKRKRAARARRQTLIHQQQRQAEQQIRNITQTAFEAMVKEASRPRRLDDYLRR